ncbi:hypothetical protein BDN70DRAFT_108758 [Pholiota conissans]|uniref:Uncharacterized protein n=1 Tax=Pholiota conissans TaxID=109636 RepID=A0A9P5YXB0_9AGAR|nr:hypothetical protein BDN70DRAFT_108758 [Pholiota conissans]
MRTMQQTTRCDNASLQHKMSIQDDNTRCEAMQHNDLRQWPKTTPQNDDAIPCYRNHASSALSCTSFVPPSPYQRSSSHTQHPAATAKPRRCHCDRLRSE